MNPFRQLIQRANNQPPIGTWVLSNCPLVAEAVGHAGFDWGVLDMDQSALDLPALVPLLQAIAGTRMQPLLRLPGNDKALIQRVLDAGAQTLLVPGLQDAADAERAVAATRYPPQGVRASAGISRGSRFGTWPEPMRTSNAAMAVVAQLQTPQALEQLEAIAAVDGIDALFVSAVDLAGTMGHAGKPSHPAVMRLLAEVAARCRACAKPVGTVGPTPEVVAQYRAMGYGFVAVASDLSLLMQAAQAAIKALRSPSGEHVHDLAAGTRQAAGA